MGYLIYAVDDEESIRSLYACALNGSEFCVQTFENGKDFFDGLEEKSPDLILLDVMLDGMDGLEILKTLKSTVRYADIPVIMVSAKTQEVDKVVGLNSGANDYIAKPFGVMELIARIKANLRKTIKTNKLEYKGLCLDDSTHTLSVNGEPVGLTGKEYKLLKLLLQNVETVVTREDIFLKVWGDNVFTETRTLDIHVAELRKKISGAQAAINTVRGVGYILQ